MLNSYINMKEASKSHILNFKSKIVERAEREFGFLATTPLEQGLKETVDWYLRSPRIAVAAR